MIQARQCALPAADQLLRARLTLQTSLPTQAHSPRLPTLHPGSTHRAPILQSGHPGGSTTWVPPPKGAQNRRRQCFLRHRGPQNGRRQCLLHQRAAQNRRRQCSLLQRGPKTGGANVPSPNDPLKTGGARVSSFKGQVNRGRATTSSFQVRQNPRETRVVRPAGDPMQCCTRAAFPRGPPCQSPPSGTARRNPTGGSP